ncbi:WD40 repeat-like protein [Piedraia hortae CBS 480.64]|uniref:WD40 repeat-like protein n=1 Tax=Piedraia hortae CBS 480.64 TaxID=1314780 RepID=A0A6A7CBM4_9PEZI|nr:WD40 repeat-like protein [Piedraia hortae CBS 480.64]
MPEQPLSPPPAPESMATREELDFDDNDDSQHEQQEQQQKQQQTATDMQKTTTDKPKPLTPRQQAEQTLIEAFPSIEVKVVRAVLQASGGQVEPAFNALLGMSDPDFQEEQTALPSRNPPQQSRSQVEADERIARQLAEQYNSLPRGGHTYNQREPARRRPNQQHSSDSDEHERNFFDDDLPEIGRTLRQGFGEAQKKVNSWITTISKKLDGESEDDEEDLYSSPKRSAGPSSQRQNFGPSQRQQLHGVQKSASGRRSTEAQRYDADPHELDPTTFDRLELHDDEAPSPPPKPPRTSSRTAATEEGSSAVRPPQKGPVDEVEAADPNDKSRKWQPLTAVAPHPEDDNDPFSLGDDEDDVKDKTEDIRKEDSERLKQQARKSSSAGVSGGKILQEREKDGAKDKEAEELLTTTPETGFDSFLQPTKMSKSKQYLQTYSISECHAQSGSIFSLTICTLSKIRSHLISASGAPDLQVHSLSGGSPHADSAEEENPFPHDQTLQSAHKLGCHHVCSSSDGRTFASVGFDGIIKVWESNEEAKENTWTLRSTIDTKGRAWAIALDAKGEVIKTTTAIGRVIAYDTTTKAVNHEFEAKESFALCIDVSQDGSMTATGYHNGSIFLFSNTTNSMAHVLTGLVSPVRCVRFSPAGKYLAAAGDARVIALYDTEAGEHVANFTGHGGWVMSLDWNHPGEYLLSGSYDGQAKVWSLERRQCVATMTEEGGSPLWAVRWLPLELATRNEAFVTAGKRGVLTFYREASGA